MRQLNRILGFGELRRGAAILHFPVQALTLWDFHVVFALERWRERERPRACAAGWRRSASSTRCRCWRRCSATIPAWAVPAIGTDAGPRRGRRSAIRSLPIDRRVANDVAVGPPGTVAAGHRLEHVGQEHAAALDRPERRAGAGRRRASCAEPVDAAANAICRRASACRIRSSAGCRTSWRRWRA